MSLELKVWKLIKIDFCCNQGIKTSTEQYWGHWTKTEEQKQNNVIWKTRIAKKVIVIYFSNMTRGSAGCGWKDSHPQESVYLLFNM